MTVKHLRKDATGAIQSALQPDTKRVHSRQNVDTQIGQLSKNIRANLRRLNNLYKAGKFDLAIRTAQVISKDCARRDELILQYETIKPEVLTFDVNAAHEGHKSDVLSVTPSPASRTHRKQKRYKLFSKV